MGWFDWIRGTARPAPPPAPDVMARILVGAIVPEASAALLAGIPAAEIRAAILARDRPGWSARYGPEVARAATHLFEECGPAAFLTPYGAQRLGLVLPKPN